MTANRSTPAEPSRDCPDLDAVDAVLDREASEADDRELRRHVARCVACNRQFGALFEVDALAPAIARGTAVSRRRTTWRRPMVAAAALVVAVALVVVMRMRRAATTDVAGLPSGPPASTVLAPRLVASRRVETELVIDAAGVRTSIRHEGGGVAGSFEYATSRRGRSSSCWSRLPTSPFDASGGGAAAPLEKSR